MLLPQQIKSDIGESISIENIPNPFKQESSVIQIEDSKSLSNNREARDDDSESEIMIEMESERQHSSLTPMNP